MRVQSASEGLAVERVLEPTIAAVSTVCYRRRSVFIEIGVVIFADMSGGTKILDVGVAVIDEVGD